MTDSVTNNEELELDEEARDEATATEEPDAGEAPEDGSPVGEAKLDPAREAELEEIEAELDAELSAVADEESASDEPTYDASDDGASDEASETEPAQEPSDGEEGALATLQSEYATLNDRHLRLAAEFNNFRRRSEQERLHAWSRAQADLVGKFLDVLDDLHRVAELDLENATVEAIMEGIDLVERKFVRALEDSNVVMIDPVGEPFDPEIMEAMMRVPAESDEQLDTVAQVFQKGYSLQGVLVRAARVSVYTSS